MSTNYDNPKSKEPKPESKSNVKDDLKTLPIAEFQLKLGSSPDSLTQEEAQKRLVKYGPNEIEEKKTNQFLKFLSYFWGPIPWMIEAAVILSAVARHWPDFGIILVLLLANGFVWGYALVWFLLNDRVKLLVYRIFDPIKSKSYLS